MSSRPPEPPDPATLDPLAAALEAGTPLWRVHHRRGFKEVQRAAEEAGILIAEG